MNLRRRRPSDPEVNLVSLIDVVFLLLLFFLLSTTFNQQSSIHISLPKSSAQQEQVPEKQVMLSIDAAGEYYVNGQHVVNRQVETLKRALSSVIGSEKNPPLIISADAKTPHQAVVTAMDAARQAGLVHLSISTQQTADTSR